MSDLPWKSIHLAFAFSILNNSWAQPAIVHPINITHSHRNIFEYNLHCISLIDCRYDRGGGVRKVALRVSVCAKH
jgi:hypothetical protein